MTDESTPARVALVYNPIKVDAKQLRETVRAFATRANTPEPLFYETTTEDLGGGDVHTRLSGVADYLAEDDAHAIALARQAVANLGLAPTPSIP